MLKGQTDWPNCIQTVAFTHNVAQAPCLGISPYHLVYNCQPRLPIDLQLLKAARRSNIPNFTATFFDEFQIWSDAIAQIVTENRQVAKQHQCARAREHGLKAGDSVYKAQYAHVSGTSSKLIPKFSGTFRIKFIVRQNNAELQNVITSQDLKVLVNLDHFYKAHQRRELIRKYWTDQT